MIDDIPDARLEDLEDEDEFSLEMNEPTRWMMTGLVMEWGELIDALRPMTEYLESVVACKAPPEGWDVRAAVKRARDLLDKIDAGEGGCEGGRQ